MIYFVRDFDDEAFVVGLTSRFSVEVGPVQKNSALDSARYFLHERFVASDGNHFGSARLKFYQN